jgi:hypothetical protein
MSALLDTHARSIELQALCREYIEAGIALVPFSFGSKGPEGLEAAGWQLRESAITSDAQLYRLTQNVGIAHAWCPAGPTCAIDFDQFDQAAELLARHGINAYALLAADDAVQITSGRPNRAKILCRLPRPMRTVKLTDATGNAILELRCASSTGGTVQDVLPPSIHPTTGLPYEWRGDWRCIPDIPAALLAFWESRLASNGTADHAAGGHRGNVQVDARTLRELQSALWAMPADDRDLWVRIGLALASIAQEDAARALWMEWSATSDKFDPADAARTWRSFAPTSTDYRAVFAEAQRRGWVNPMAKVAAAPVPVPTPWVDDAPPLGEYLTPDGDLAEIPGAQSAPKPRSLFIRAAELLKDAAPKDWILQDIYARNCLHLVFGPPKHGKSVVTLDQALRVATGHPWGEKQVERTPVFILAGEGHHGITLRMLAWQRAHGIDIGDAPVYVSSRASALIDHGVAIGLAIEVERLSAETGVLPGLVFVDTLARNFGPGDENSQKDMGAFVLGCDLIRERTGAGVVIVHHTPLTEADRPRGSSALTGAIDASYKVQKLSTGLVQWTSVEQKDAPDGGKSTWQLVGESLPILDKWGRQATAVVTLPAVDAEPLASSASAVTGKNQILALGILRDMYDECDVNLANRVGAIARVTLVEWMARFKEVCPAANKNDAWATAHKALLDKQIVVFRAPHAYLAERTDWQESEL